MNIYKNFSIFWAPEKKPDLTPIRGAADAGAPSLGNGETARSIASPNPLLSQTLTCFHKP